MKTHKTHICPCCLTVFKYRKRRHCPHCGVLLARPGESFSLIDDTGFYWDNDGWLPIFLLELEKL